MIKIIPGDYFSGGRNLVEDPDEKRELADLLIELQTAVNDILSEPAYEEVLDLLLTPPGAPNSGDRYLINGVGLGAWAGQDYAVAEWDGAAWTFESYIEGDVLLAAGTVNPANEGFWRKTATAWSFLGAATLAPCLDILLTDAGLTPADGDRYLINGTGAGGFVGHDYEVAQWNAALPGWAFTSHVKGTQVAVSGEIVAANFGTYLKGTTAWELIPAVASALELKPNSRPVKGRYVRMVNVAGDVLYTGYRTNMGTFLVLGNNNAGAGAYTFRWPRVGTSLTNTTYANYGWEALVFVPPTAHGTVVVQARNGADVVATLRPGELWRFTALQIAGTGAASWHATKVIHGAGLDSGEAVWVDGSRTDAYTPTGTEAYPYKTLQAGLDACPRLGTVKVRRATYVENVVTVADKYLDAEMGTRLRAPTGTPLTLTDDATPLPTSAFPPIWRGLIVQGEDPAAFAVHLVSSGSWSPFLVWFDQGVEIVNDCNGFWVEGGGVYLTDAGGIAGSPPILFRVGAAGTGTGGMVITGRANLSCAGGGCLFEIFENGFVMADGGNLSSDGPGADVARITADGSHGGMALFTLRGGKADGDWRSVIRATGPACIVVLENAYSQLFGRTSDEGIYMPDGGFLRITDYSLATDNGVPLVFGRNAPAPSTGNLEMVRASFQTNNAQRAIEIRGLANGTLTDVRAQNDNPNPGTALGAILLEHQGNIALNGGEYRGIGPAVNHLTGTLFLLGGVDLVAHGAGMPGGCPLASAAGANLWRGHCNFRGSFQPVIASAEALLPSSFGIIGFGGSAAAVQMSAGPLALPGGGQGYAYGSLFVHAPAGGPPQVYFNYGSEAAPNWQLMAYVAAGVGNWVGPAPATMKEAMDRVAAAVAGLLGGPIP